MERQRTRRAQLVQQQGREQFAAWRAADLSAQFGRGGDQFAQQGRHMDHAVGGRQEARGIGQHQHAAYARRAAHQEAMPRLGSQPDRGGRRHDPASGRGLDDHHAVERVQQLAARMAMEVDGKAGRIVGGYTRHPRGERRMVVGVGGKQESSGGGMSICI
ncbi:hypothetical protein D3C71_1744000 [compost metagenome]